MTFSRVPVVVIAESGRGLPVSASIGLFGWLAIATVAALVSLGVVMAMMMLTMPGQLELPDVPPPVIEEAIDPYDVGPDGAPRIVSKDHNPLVRLETTHGPIVIELFEDEKPNTVANFIELVERGFYDGIRFHRIIDGFMIQAGCPTTREGIGPGAGTGGPGYRFPDEKPNERSFDGPLHVAMANAGPDTNGSQFFITLKATPHLDNYHYTLFGHVVHGGDNVLNEIAKVPVAPNAGGEESQPTVNVQIRRAYVVQKRDHEYHVTDTMPDGPDGDDDEGDGSDDE